MEHLEGVIVLSEYVPNLIIPAILILFVGSAIIFLGLCVVDDVTELVVVCVLLGIGLIATGARLGMSSQPTCYKVMLEDNVSVNEFIGIYDIIEADGKIYTIKFKGE